MSFATGRNIYICEERSSSMANMAKPSVMGRPSVFGWNKGQSRKESQMSWGARSSTSSNISKKSRRESQFKKDSFDASGSRKVSDVAGIRKESLVAVRKSGLVMTTHFFWNISNSTVNPLFYRNPATVHFIAQKFAIKLQVPELLDTGEEEVQVGSIGFKVYKDYYKAGTGYIFFTFFFILSLVTQVNFILIPLVDLPSPLPQQDPILSFSHLFSPKSTHLGCWHPLNGVGPPHKGKSWIHPCMIQITSKTSIRTKANCPLQDRNQNT